MNEGKKFENDFKNSVPKHCFYYRFKDGTGNFAGHKNDNVRFQAKNICDCMVWNSKTSRLYLIELKSHKGKSVPISCIRDNQIKGLLEAREKNINCHIVINMRDAEKTYAIPIRAIKRYIDNTNRKSIPISFMEDCGILITQEKKKVNYKYDLEYFLI